MSKQRKATENSAKSELFSANSPNIRAILLAWAGHIPKGLEAEKMFGIEASEAGNDKINVAINYQIICSMSGSKLLGILGSIEIPNCFRSLSNLYDNYNYN